MLHQLKVCVIKSMWSIKTASSDSTFVRPDGGMSDLSFRDLIDKWTPYRTEAHWIFYKDTIDNIIKLTTEYISKVRRDLRYGVILNKQEGSGFKLYLIYYFNEGTHLKIYTKDNWWEYVYELPNTDKEIRCTNLEDVYEMIERTYKEKVINIRQIS